MTLEAPQPPRAESRNVLGGPVRNGNANPGTGRVHPGRPPGDRTIEKLLGKPTDSPLGDRSVARETFNEVLTDDLRRHMLYAMIARAISGDTTAANLLMRYDLGVPTAPPRGGRVGDPKEPARDAGEAFDRLLAKRKQELEEAGVDSTLLERLVEDALWDNDVAPHAEDGPGGS